VQNEFAASRRVPFDANRCHNLDNERNSLNRKLRLE